MYSNAFLIVFLFYITSLLHSTVLQHTEGVLQRVLSDTLHSSPPPIMVFLLVPPHAASSLFVPLYWGVCLCVRAPGERFEDGLDLSVCSPRPAPPVWQGECVCVCVSVSSRVWCCSVEACSLYVCVCFSMWRRNEKKNGVGWEQKWICASGCMLRWMCVKRKANHACALRALVRVCCMPP